MHFGKVMYILLHLIWIINKDLFIARGTLLSFLWQPGWRRVWGSGMHVRVCLRPFVVHLKLPQCWWLAMMLLFSHSVVPDSVWSHELQHARLPCLSLSPRVCPNACPLTRWCHPTRRMLCGSLLLLPSIFLNIRVYTPIQNKNLNLQK